MKAYVYALILTAVVAAIAELLADGGGSSGAVRMVAGLCVLLALIQPIREGIVWLQSAAEGEIVPEEWVSLPEGDPKAEEVFGEQLLHVSQQAVEAEALSLLRDRFDVPSDGCRIRATVVSEGHGVRVERMTVLLSGSAALKNPHTIKAFMENTFGGECAVAVE